MTKFTGFRYQNHPASKKQMMPSKEEIRVLLQSELDKAKSNIEQLRRVVKLNPQSISAAFIPIGEQQIEHLEAMLADLDKWSVLKSR